MKGIPFYAFVIFLVGSVTLFAAEPKKVAIFYISYGAGHISAAKAIEARVKQRDPNVEVKLIDLNDYYHSPTRAKIDKKLYWLIVKNFPSTFTKMYQGFSEGGRRAVSMEDLPKYYNHERIANDLKGFSPDVIVATHYGSAETVAQLRTDPALRDVPVGWLHTDYVRSYFPRISKAVDMSFLPHEELEQVWKAEGVPANKFVTTGMPLNPKLFDSIDRAAFLTSKGLNPEAKTISIASGAEGVGDYPLIVKKLTESVEGPLQIIAFCGNNKKHEAALNKMKKSLPKNVNLVVKQGFVPQEELLNHIKSSDLYITKGGGLSPTEGFAINVPMVILDVYGGHESENAELFERLNLAQINRDQSKIGEDAKRVLGDKKFQEEMLVAQKRFRNSLNADRITDFIFEPNKETAAVPAHFGSEGGPRATGTQVALQRLDHDSPADIELLTAYAASKNEGGLRQHTNPFGHTAIRIGDTVFTANHIAKPGVDKEMMTAMSLDEYLYGTKKFTENAEHGSSFGLAYARHNIGLRVRGLKPEQLEKMHAEIARINEAFNRGEVTWDLKQANCADYVLQVLKAGDVNFDPQRKFTLPRDVLDKALEVTKANPKLKTEVVAYSKHPEASSTIFKKQTAPISFYKPGSILRAWREKADPILKRVTKVVSAYAGSTDVHYENANGVTALHETETPETAKTNVETVQAPRATGIRAGCKQIMKTLASVF